MSVFVFQAVLIYRGIPYLWALSGNVTAYFGYGSEHEVRLLILFISFNFRKLLYSVLL